MPKSRRFRRGIYILPTVFTVGNLFCGFGSVLQAYSGEFGWAALLIIIAGLLDGLDGRIARLTNTTSEFGIEFDSLADVVSFGVAPAFLAYSWALAPLERLGWWIAFVYLVCIAMRLARFNIQRTVADKRYFAGLPSPAAAGILSCVVFAFPAPPERGWASGLVVALVVVVSGLTVSRLRYRSFKEVDLRNRRSYLYVLPLAVILVAILTLPEISLLVLGGVYLVSGPVGYAWGLATRRRRDPNPSEIVDEPSAH
jgi:CDP-diacylglycerol--serine O-phosphatidyltransferase